MLGSYAYYYGSVMLINSNSMVTVHNSRIANSFAILCGAVHADINCLFMAISSVFEENVSTEEMEAA